LRDHFKEILNNSKQLKVLVVGDLIYDEFIWGDVQRISPEAPVQVVEWKADNDALGGAANVANNLAALGCHVYMSGIVGNDEKGARVIELLKEKGIEHKGVIRDKNRPTSNKTRIIAQNQQILRIDKENKNSITEEIEKKLCRYAEKIVSEIDGIICSDYLKGVLTENIIGCLVKEARKQGKMIIADPKGTDYSKYKGINVLTPNKLELENASHIKIVDNGDLKRAAGLICEQCDSDAILVTRGKEGMSLFEKNGELCHIPTEAREVFDVTGAGDTAISLFGIALFSGASKQEASKLATIGAGIVVAKVGTSVVKKEEIEHFLKENEVLIGNKILGIKELKYILNSKRNEGNKIVFTNGCFDILHVGHIQYLQKAMEFGDLLVLGLNDDDSVRKLKGPKRPLINQDERANILAALDCIDYIALFSELTPENIIKEVMPDILVKGGDYLPKDVVGKDIVESYGGRVEIVPFIEGYSTSSIVKKIIDKYRD
jgi:D-beta-D-heptose 7-phosphate kinase / D-beta-D-heptose 1-phosphate adenosyltransferase